MNPKIIVTTSDNYHHLLPIFCHLFNKFWSKDQFVEVVGYKKPDFELPNNFTFYSLGQWSGNKKDFSNDLRPYFEKQDDWFIWLFEDTFIKKPINFDNLRLFNIYMHSKTSVGRINLSDECCKQINEKWCSLSHVSIYRNSQAAEYRLSTQPSIWNKNFLLQYLKPNLSPWDFETQQPKYDGWEIIGMDRDNCPLKHNEGVTRHDIYKYNFDGIDQQTLSELKKIINNES